MSLQCCIEFLCVWILVGLWFLQGRFLDGKEWYCLCYMFLIYVFGIVVLFPSFWKLQRSSLKIYSCRFWLLYGYFFVCLHNILLLDLLTELLPVSPNTVDGRRTIFCSAHPVHAPLRACVELGGVPWQFGGFNSVLPLQGARVPSSQEKLKRNLCDSFSKALYLGMVFLCQKTLIYTCFYQVFCLSGFCLILFVFQKT